MKLVLTLLGVVLLVVAAVYFLLPADQLPGFFPGHEAGVTRMHYKHGIASGIVGVVLTAILAPIAAMLVQMAISRTREYEADRMGAMLSGQPRWLASRSAPCNL